MSEESTRDMPDARSFEERVFARFDAMEARFDAMDIRFNKLETRLIALEDKVDARLRETRPIWEAMKMQLDKIESKMDVIAVELLDMRADQVMLAKRISKLEERPPA